jgi:hypothetical protein
MDMSQRRHPRCYARTLGGCSSKISREHYFSRSVLTQIHANPIVEGLPGQPESGRYSIASLTANILCAYHNTMLSPLDTVAAEVFKVIDQFEVASATAASAGPTALTDVSGEGFERWLLKVSFGLCKGKIAKSTERGTRTTSLRHEDLLLGILFGQESWPKKWGMYLGQPAQPAAAPANLGFEPRSHPETNELLMLVARLRATEFWLCFGKPEPVSPGKYRPGAVEFYEARSGRSAMLNFSWSDGESHERFRMERIGEQEGWGTR